jgi:hypothetical protein
MRSPQVPPLETPPRVSLEPPAYFEAVEQAFQRAGQAAGGLTQRDYRLGGCRVRLSFAGEALVPYLTPALAHLAQPIAGAPDLAIHLFETASTGSAPPPPPWDYHEFSGSGLIRSFTTDQVFTYFQFGANALSLVDVKRGQALFWIKAASQMPTWEKAAPLKAILALWLNRRGLTLVHSGAVGLPAGGVLLAGAGGSGKSNTALSTLPSALRYAGDDYTLLSLEPEPAVYSLYSTGKTQAADLARLPFLSGSISNPEQLGQEKALYFLNERWPEKMIERFPLRAILLPRLSGERDSRLRPAGPAAGLNALAPSTLNLSPALEQASFKRLVLLFRQVPAYHLDLGSDPAQPSQLILGLLK